VLARQTVSKDRYSTKKEAAEKAKGRGKQGREASGGGW